MFVLKSGTQILHKGLMMPYSVVTREQFIAELVASLSHEMEDIESVRNARDHKMYFGKSTVSIP